MIREPAVAGRFYPRERAQLERDVRRHLDAGATSNASAKKDPSAAPLRAFGCVVPHAGYMYSGGVAGAVFARLELPRRFIILCPRHYPQGVPLAILSEGAWRTPLGDAPVDEPLAAAITHACPLLREDAVAHAPEHAIEVELPFLQVAAPGFRFVPISLGTDRLPVLEDLGRAVAGVVAAQQEPVLIVASSDMNHYESEDVTRRKDARAIDRILAIDPRGLYDLVRRENISMCGYGPTVTMLAAAKQLGATRPELIEYATSAEVSGDFERVVGYAGVAVA
jgi:MEMO1 family protein